MNINTKALKGVIEEVEASKLRQKAEADFQREAIKRAVKEHQLDGKAIRIVLQRRAMGDQKRDEQDYFVHSYELALGGKKLAADALANGATVREAAAIGGISTGAAGNLAKVVQKSPKLDTPHDSDGVVTETQESTDTPAPRGSSLPWAPEAAEVPLSAATPASQNGGVEAGTSFAMSLMGTLQPADEAPAPRSVGAVGPSSARVAPPSDEAALAAMEEAGAKWNAARARV